MVAASPRMLSPSKVWPCFPASCTAKERSRSISKLWIPLSGIRQLLGTHKDLARKLEELEGKYDAKFRVVFDAIRKLMGPEKPPPQRRIGFETEKE